MRAYDMNGPWTNGTELGATNQGSSHAKETMPARLAIGKRVLGASRSHRLLVTKAVEWLEWVAFGGVEAWSSDKIIQNCCQEACECGY
jgi:hypothetical protein